MSFFNSSKKSNGEKVFIPPEIMARVSVMNDHMMAVGTPPASDNEALHETVTIPISATAVPHGPFSVEDPDLSSAPTISVQPVSQESVDSSPFLQTLPPESLLVSEKVKPQVESPMFLTDNKQTSQFGFGQVLHLPRPLIASQASKNEQDMNLVFRQSPPPPTSQKTWWMLGIFCLLLLAALGGAYYYFYIYSEKMRNPSENAGPQPSTVSVEPADTKPDFEFSLTSPNYLSVNVETVSVESLRSQLESIGAKMKLAKIASPVEFFITDQTNTPIAFSRFVVLVGLSLPQDIVSMANENFSLFLFNDQNRSRVGLRISLKDGKMALEKLRRAEAGLPVNLQNFFLESTVPVAKKYVYKESLYNGKKIRYVNISDTEVLSVDYSVDGNDWFVATSKNAMRAMLDVKKK